MKRHFLIALLATITSGLLANGFRHQSGSDVRVSRIEWQEPVIRTALELLGRDVRSVLGDTVREVHKNAEICLSIDPESLENRAQAFHIEVRRGRLCVTGSDAHGLAYGILEISRFLGVSPWEWWADVTPEKRDELFVADAYRTTQSPSVEYRGIFINDEDWGMMPWSGQTYEPECGRGVIGPKTNSRIFELLLRLRANYFWPAMHECTQPFFLTEGNREVAERYGIYIGGSHCEPMACSPAGEWRRRGTGDYDYVHNSASVQDFWRSRLREVKGQPIVYTLGMRGVHDGRMQGAKTLDEQRETLQRILDDQRTMLSAELRSDIGQIPQVFVPYKEVLDIYNSGLRVPDDVCLMWCDDNYGYINHFPTSEERARSGGNGVYYHVSYWGRPHDYLWLGTFSPNLLFQQMHTAYDNGIQRIWVLNVGDIKPAEYQIELFLDMAWNIGQCTELGPSRHLRNFLARTFGDFVADDLVLTLERSYALAFDCKPEFLGHTRVEERDPAFKIVTDMPWSESFIRQRIAAYDSLSDAVEHLAVHIPEALQDAYFQLVKYPVQAAAQMNRKMLFGQLARHGLSDWHLSDAAYDSIQSLTALYNNGIHNSAKWHGIMDAAPRKLPVFAPLEHRSDSTLLPAESTPVFHWKSDGQWTPLDSLLSLDFALSDAADSLLVIVDFLPAHPLNNQHLRFSIGLDNHPLQTRDIRTKGRSEEWKKNVLTNRSRQEFLFLANGIGQHHLTLKPLDEPLFVREITIKTAR